MTEAISINLLSWMINYFIHSTLFISVLLIAIKLNWVKSDRNGEWLMKSALVLGAVTATLQVSGLLNNHQLSTPIFQKAIDTKSSQKTDDKPNEMSIVGARKSPEVNKQRVPITTEKSTKNQLNTSQNKNNQSEVLFNQNTWILIWVLMVAFFLIKLLIQKRNVYQILKDRTHISDSSINRIFEKLTALGQFKKTVTLAQSQNISTPIALSNEVVLPQSFLKAPIDQIEAAMAHELAHIKRKDYHWLNFSHWFQVLTFFQPLNHLINQQIHQLAELNADDMAASWTNNPKALAKTLFSVAEKNTLTQTQMVPAMTSKKSKLLERIENIINQPNRKTNPLMTLGFTALFLLIIVAAPGVVAKTQIYHSKDGSEVRVSSNIEYDGGKSKLSVKITDDDRTINVKAKLSGEIQFNDDESKIIQFPANSYFDITEDDGIEKRLLVKSGSKGEAEYTYSEEGNEMTYNADAQAWFASIIPDVFRATGLQAEARVKRIQFAQGDGAVLNEIALINSDFVRKSYFKHLFNISELNQSDLEEALTLASDIRSDFELSHVLEHAIATQNIKSEIQWQQYMQATQTIQSDFEMAKTMINALEYLPQSNDINEAYFNAAETIQSDFELAKVLKAYISKQPTNSINMVKMFELATSIQSDFELANVLKHANSQLGEDENAFEAYLDLATTIQSDFEMKHVYSNLLQYNLSSDLLNKIVESAANEIASDFELAGLLEEVARQDGMNESVKQSIIDAAKDKIGSGFEREKVFSAVL